MSKLGNFTVSSCLPACEVSRLDAATLAHAELFSSDKRTNVVIQHLPVDAHPNPQIATRRAASKGALHLSQFMCQVNLTVDDPGTEGCRSSGKQAYLSVGRINFDSGRRLIAFQLLSHKRDNHRCIR